MSTMVGSQFVFALCQHGAERALKGDVARRRPELRAAYQRPGLVTFRASADLAPSFDLRSPLARVFGLSLGGFDDLDALCERLASLPAPLRLHVSERERFGHDEAPKDYAAGAEAARIDALLRAHLPAQFHASSEAEPGELVADVIAGEPGESLLLGVHTHDARRSPHPGGLYRYELPADAPSRAYAKIEEAIRAFDLPVRAGDVALELGSAPGGASYALLRRGVAVIGVDPAAMDPHVLGFEGPGGARLSHLSQPMAAVDLRALSAEHPRIDWLLCDVHLAPQVALRQLSRFFSHLRPSLLGAVLTLKLNDWSFLEQLDRFEGEARALGLVEPVARQLPAHRRELALAGLTRRGLSRSGRAAQPR